METEVGLMGPPPLPDGMPLRVEDFDDSYARMRIAGVEFGSEPRDEPYGKVAVFVDVAGNQWDLLGPRPAE